MVLLLSLQEQSEGHIWLWKWRNTQPSACSLGTGGCCPLRTAGHVPDKGRPTERCELKGHVTKHVSGSRRAGQLLTSGRRGQGNRSYESATLWLVEMAP